MEFQGEKRKIVSWCGKNGNWFHEFTIPKQINIFFKIRNLLRLVRFRNNMISWEHKIRTIQGGKIIFKDFFKKF